MRRLRTLALIILTITVSRITLKIEGSTYPNLEGTDPVRPFVIEGDQLKVTNPAPSSGGGPSQLVYKRAK